MWNEKIRLLLQYVATFIWLAMKIIFTWIYHFTYDIRSVVMEFTTYKSRNRFTFFSPFLWQEEHKELSKRKGLRMWSIQHGYVTLRCSFYIKWHNSAIYRRKCKDTQSFAAWLHANLIYITQSDKESESPDERTVQPLPMTYRKIVAFMRTEKKGL